MSIFEKIDPERHRRDIYLCKPVSQPSPVSVSPPEPEARKRGLSRFLKDLTTESAIPAKLVTPISSPANLIDQETRAVSNRTEA